MHLPRSPRPFPHPHPPSLARHAQVKPVDGPTALAHALATGRGECIAVNTSKEGIIVNPQTLSHLEVGIVARRIREEATRLAQNMPKAKL